MASFLQLLWSGGIIDIYLIFFKNHRFDVDAIFILLY